MRNNCDSVIKLEHSICDADLLPCKSFKMDILITLFVASQDLAAVGQSERPKYWNNLKWFKSLEGRIRWSSNRHEALIKAESNSFRISNESISLSDDHTRKGCPFKETERY
jgi:hypothetical protein